MDEATHNVTVDESADNGTAADQQIDAAGTPATEPPAREAPRTYSEDEYQRMSTAQYAAGLSSAMRAAGYEPTRSADFKVQLSSSGSSTG